MLTGLGSENVNGSRVKTLDAILNENGHTDAVINYLKVPRSRRLLREMISFFILQVDVEGAERESMMQWLRR